MPQPFRSKPMVVEPQWTDYNGHLNMAYYNVLFDRAGDDLLDMLGIGAAYAKEQRKTIYTAETHVCYLRELHQGATVTVDMRLIDIDAKRMHLFQEMRHSEGWLAATCEVLSLHVDMNGPRVANFPDDRFAALKALADDQATMPLPDGVGRRIGIVKKVS